MAINERGEFIREQPAPNREEAPGYQEATEQDKKNLGTKVEQPSPVKQEE